jgi:hypothetical protein
VQNLIHNTIIADSELVVTGEILCRSFGFDGLQILCQPTDSIHNAAGDRWIEPRQIAGGRI